MSLCSSAWPRSYGFRNCSITTSVATAIIGGLSIGALAAGWIAFILSRGNHTKVHVQEWSQSLHHTLSHLLAQPLLPAEFSDDRLGILLRRLQQLDDWDALEADLWHGACDVYKLPLERVRLDSTTTYGYHAIAPDGLMQLGHSKDHRPNLPQLKIMAAAAGSGKRDRKRKRDRSEKREAGQVRKRDRSGSGTGPGPEAGQVRYC